MTSRTSLNHQWKIWAALVGDVCKAVTNRPENWWERLRIQLTCIHLREQDGRTLDSLLALWAGNTSPTLPRVRKEVNVGTLGQGSNKGPPGRSGRSTSWWLRWSPLFAVWIVPTLSDGKWSGYYLGKVEAMLYIWMKPQDRCQIQLKRCEPCRCCRS